MKNTAGIISAMVVMLQGGGYVEPPAYKGPQQRSNGTLPLSEAKRICDHDKRCRKGTRAKFRKRK